MKTKRKQPFAVSPQTEEYLEAVCRIHDRHSLATPTDLARELRVAPPSVVGMLRRLKRQGLVAYTRRKGATLTKRGVICAGALRRHHRLAERMLTDLLRIPWERAHAIACRFEHVIDDEVEHYLVAALHHPTTCPHGNPLDGKDSTGWQLLATLSPGQAGFLRRVVDESSETLTYLRQIELLPGTRVTVCSLAPARGPLTVKVKGVRHGLSRDVAERLLVEKEVRKS